MPTDNGNHAGLRSRLAELKATAAALERVLLGAEAPPAIAAAKATVAVDACATRLAKQLQALRAAAVP
jgi:hypothetical protein